MTATDLDPVAPASTAVATTTARDLRRTLRTPVRIVLVLVALAVVVTVVKGTASDERLDPASPAKDGARAVAALLADRGSPVTRVPLVSDARTSGSTVVVATPEKQTDDELQRTLDLARTTDVVVLIGDVGTAESLGVDATERDPGKAYAPGCSLPAAVAAGKVDELGLSLIGTPDGFTRTDRCYEGGVLRFTPDDGTGSLILTGGTRWLTNDFLADQGNAALAVDLIGGHPVSWVAPLPGEQRLGATGDRQGLSAALPRGIKGMCVQLGVAVLLLALAMGRRLGPVVAERLPVQVRGTETSRGRARLWAAARAHDRAALAFREHARSRAAGALGLSPTTTPAALVDQVAERSGRPSAEVQDLLFGKAPSDDAGLAALADGLDHLVQSVRTPTRPEGAT